MATARVNLVTSDRKEHPVSMEDQITLFFRDNKQELLPSIKQSFLELEKKGKFSKEIGHLLVISPFKENYKHAEKNVLIIMNHVSRCLTRKSNLFIFTRTLATYIIHQTHSPKVLDLCLKIIINRTDLNRRQIQAFFRRNFLLKWIAQENNPDIRKNFYEIFFRYLYLCRQQKSINVTFFLNVIQTGLNLKLIDSTDALSVLSKGFGRKIENESELAKAIKKAADEHYKEFDTDSGSSNRFNGQCAMYQKELSEVLFQRARLENTVAETKPAHEVKSNAEVTFSEEVKLNVEINPNEEIKPSEEVKPNAEVKPNEEVKPSQENIKTDQEDKSSIVHSEPKPFFLPSFFKFSEEELKNTATNDECREWIHANYFRVFTPLVLTKTQLIAVDNISHENRKKP